jgi:hypothetical protein
MVFWLLLYAALYVGCRSATQGTAEGASSQCSSGGYFWIYANSASVELVCLLESRATSFSLVEL